MLYSSSQSQHSQKAGRVMAHHWKYLTVTVDPQTLAPQSVVPTTDADVYQSPDTFYGYADLLDILGEQGWELVGTIHVPLLAGHFDLAEAQVHLIFKHLQNGTA
jgi:hypothetical protein